MIEQKEGQEEEVHVWQNFIQEDEKAYKGGKARDDGSTLV